MRSFIIALVAGAALAAPLAAQDRPERAWRGERGDAARPEGRTDQPRQQPPRAPDDRDRGPQGGQDGSRNDRGGPRDGGGQDARADQPGRFAGQPGSRVPDGGRPDRPGFDRDGRDRFDPGARPDPRFAPDRARGRNDAGPERFGDRDPRRGIEDRFDRGRPGAYAGNYGAGGWNRGWRNDRRYDWQDRRGDDRGRYRFGRYAPPRGIGYGYRHWSVGTRIAPVWFARDYWLDDAAAYGLPSAYGPYRWVRYYDDVLLIDLRTGLVADVVPAFFL